MIRDYLESQRPGLGEEFLEELSKASGRIEQFPQRYAMYNKLHRLCPMHRFKIGIYYYVGTNVYIDAVIDLRRSPRYVRRRLKW